MTAVTVWKELVDTILVGEHRGTAGAVCGYDGGVWGMSDSFHITQDEAVAARRAVGRAFRDFEDAQKIAFTVSGVEFHTVSFDSYAMELRAKCKKYVCGVTVKVMSRAIVIGYYDAPITADENVIAVRRLARYLLDLHVCE